MKVVFDEIKVLGMKNSNALSWARDRHRLGKRSRKDKGPQMAGGNHAVTS